MTEKDLNDSKEALMRSLPMYLDRVSWAMEGDTHVIEAINIWLQTRMGANWKVQEVK